VATLASVPPALSTWKMIIIASIFKQSNNILYPCDSQNVKILMRLKENPLQYGPIFQAALDQLHVRQSDSGYVSSEENQLVIHVLSSTMIEI